MPMIDVYATAGTFTHKHQLAADLATAVMTIEQVPDPLSRAGTAAGLLQTGLLQTGQRIGASIGIAAAGSAFFSTLRGHGSFADAYRNGIFVTSGLTAAALLLALTDRHRGRRARDETV